MLIIVVIVEICNMNVTKLAISQSVSGRNGVWLSAHIDISFCFGLAWHMSVVLAQRKSFFIFYGPVCSD